MIANERGIYVRMRVSGGNMQALAIMKANDILQTKYVTHWFSNIVYFGSPSIGDSVYIVIDDVTQNMETSWNDATLGEQGYTAVYINNDNYNYAYGTWTSTIEPNNSKVELNCVVVDNSTDVIVAACYSETTWDESVFNRIPIRAESGNNIKFGAWNDINHALFGTDSFQIIGSVPSEWKQYSISGHGSNLTIGDNQLTIMGLPESFVSHWANMGAKVCMGNYYGMFVPPNDP